MKNNKKWIFVILLILLFILLSIFVKLNLLESFDTYCYNLIASNINDSKTSIYKFLTIFGSTIFIVLLCLIFLIIFTILKKKNYGLVITGVLIVSTIMNNLVKIIIMRERPAVLKLVEENTFSYPSGHTMAATSMYGILLYLIIKSNMKKGLKIFLSIILIILPILVAISRIYLGAHFASDVIGAILLSCILLLLLTTYIEKKEWLV